MIKNVLQLAIFSALMSPFSSVMAHEDQERGFNLYVPSLASANEFSISALFLRVSGSNDYGVLISPFNADVTAPALSPSWEAKGINTHYRPGFSLDWRHVYSNSGNDVKLNWAHLHNNKGNTYPVNRDAPPAEQMTGPFFTIGPDAQSTSAANGNVTNHYDVVNGEIGKQVNFDEALKMRFFAGISGLFLKQTNTGNFSGQNATFGTYTFSNTTTSKYNAGGLRLGLEGAYPTCYKLNVVGLLAGNVFVGREKPNTESIGTSTFLAAAGIPENVQFISHKHYTQVVPALDAKLGLKHVQEYRHGTVFSLEAGYMASIYVNAIQNYVASTYVPGTSGIASGSLFLQSLIKTTESFSVDGPYLTIALKY